MFRKSLQALFASALLALAAVVAYATLHLSDAEDAVDRAAGMIARGEYQSAVSELGLAEGQARGAVLERLRRLRYAANTRLQNARAALLDVGALLRDGLGDDQELLLDRIRLLALARDAEGARLAAREFLERWPGHSRALELAGEACQTQYQPLLRDVDGQLERHLAHTELDDARTAMLSFVYRPDRDPEVERNLEALQQTFSQAPRLTAAWSTLAKDLRTLRDLVQQGLAFFQQSLEAGGEPVAAFQQFAWALDQSQRIDDLLVACEIQRRCFDHVYVDDAGALATWALTRDGLVPAAVATAERWVPPGTLADRIAADRFGAGTSDLLLGRTWAAWKSGDPLLCQRAGADVGAMWQGKVPATPAMFLAGPLFWPANNPEAERSLRFAIDQLLRSPLPPGRPDLVSAAMAMYLDLLIARDADEGEVQAALTRWSTARPGAVEPSLALADFLLQRGRTAAALAALDDARTKHPGDERIFDRHLAALRVHVRGTDHDGPALLAQCISRRAGVPEVRGDSGYLYLLCGEAALAEKTWWIARACARAAIDALPQARPPRLLDLRVLLAERQYDDAARQGRRLLELLPPDAQTVALVLEACRAADLPRRDVLAAAMTTPDQGPVLQAELLRHALADRPAAAAAFVTAAARSPEAPAELRMLAANALAVAGDQAGAAGLLAGLAAGAPALSRADHAALCATVAAWVVLAAPKLDDTWFAVELEQLLARIGSCAASGAKAMLSAAAELADSRPKTAAVLCTHALAAADAEDRGGETWMLAGRLFARVHDWRRAEDAWTAALAFADGAAAAEPLARLCMAQGRSERALQVVQLVDTPGDAALVARYGSREAAAALLAGDLERDRADLLAHAALALLGEESPAPWPAADEAARDGRLELLSMLHDPALGPLALERARALHEQHPDSTTVQLLLARALADTGDGAGASALHQALDAQGVNTPVLWREVALAAEAPGYVAGPALMTNLVNATTAGAIAESPVTLAFVMSAMTKGFTAGGHEAMAEQLRLTTWLRTPRAQPLTAADLDLVVRGLRPAEAWYVIDEALQGPLPAERAAAIDRLHELAALLVRTDREAAEGVHTAARRYLASDGPRGSIVHFLLDAGDTVPAWRVADDERRALLREHLELAASGRDGDERLPATVRALVADEGADAVRKTIDALLQRHPTTLRLWVERARLGAGPRRARKTLDDLRAVLARAEAPALRLEAVTLAAEARSLSPADVVWFQALPPGLQLTPDGAYAAGMVALRHGNPDVAVAALSVAAPRWDGMHLFALGLAVLQSSAGDGVERAREAFAMLVRDYPSSSLARHAGSFANQLAPR